MTAENVECFLPILGQRGLMCCLTLDFVHIDEGSTLSPALRTVFLPHRRDVLEKFITDREARVAFGALPEGQTIDGRPVDAAN